MGERRSLAAEECSTTGKGIPVTPEVAGSSPVAPVSAAWRIAVPTNAHHAGLDGRSRWTPRGPAHLVESYVGARLPSMAVHPWPDIPDKHRWVLELMEERLEQTTQPARELSARADGLRAQAAQTDIEGYRDAALALADRYEQAAAARLASA